MTIIPRPDCPTDDDLRAFHLGNLAVAGQDAVAAHPDACPDCDSRIARVERSADPVLSALRHATPPAWAASTSGATVSFSRGDTSPDTGTIARAGSAALAFLAPPRPAAATRSAGSAATGCSVRSGPGAWGWCSSRRTPRSSGRSR